MKTKTKIAFIVTALAVVVILSVLPWVITAVSALFSKKPPEPKNKYGEFPFKLVYESGDKTITLEDSLVIEYLGTGYNEGIGKYNKWNTYYKSDNK